MVGNETKVVNSVTDEIRKFEPRELQGVHCPYYWSWYGAIFGEPKTGNKPQGKN